MNAISSVISLHLRRTEQVFGIPLAILGSAFAVNLIICFALGGKVTIYTGGLSSIFIYYLIAGTLIPGETFLFAIGFSVRRRDYFIGTMAFAIGLSVAWAIVLLVLALVEEKTSNWGLGLHFFHLPYVGDNAFFGQLWLFFIAMLTSFAIGFVPASVYRRFRMLGVYLFFGALMLPLSVFSALASYRGWWQSIFTWLFKFSAPMLGLGILPLTALGLLFSYVMLRKATV